MNKTHFEITIERQMLALLPLIVRYLVISTLYIYYFSAYFADPLFIGVSLFFLLTDILPTVYIHINYLFQNLNAKLYIDVEKEKITYQQGLVVIEKSFSEIAEVEYYFSYGKGSRWYSFGEYRFYKLIFTDNVELNLTSLMIKNINKALKPLFVREPEKMPKVLPLIKSKK